MLKKAKAKPRKSKGDPQDRSPTDIGVNNIDLIEMGITDIKERIKTESIAIQPSVIAMIRRRLAEFLMRGCKMVVFSN